MAINDLKEFGAFVASMWILSWGSVRIMKTLLFTELVILSTLSISFCLQMAVPLRYWMTLYKKPMTGSEIQNMMQAYLLSIFGHLIGLVLTLKSVRLLNAGIKENDLRSLEIWKLMRSLFLTLTLLYINTKLFLGEDINGMTISFALYNFACSTAVHCYMLVVKLEAPSPRARAVNTERPIVLNEVRVFCRNPTVEPATQVKEAVDKEAPPTQTKNASFPTVPTKDAIQEISE